MADAVRDYNGFANWETWNLALYLFNTERVTRMIEQFKPFNCERAITFCLIAFPTGTPDMLDNSAYQYVDWYEITEALNE